MVETKVDVSARKKLPPGSHYPFAAPSDCIRALDTDRERLMAEVDALAAKLAEAERERDEAVAAIDPMITDMRLANGQIDLVLSGAAMERLASVVAKHFRASGATNYIEMSLFERAPPNDRFVVTVQRVQGKSPHDLRAKAEADLTAAQATITQLREESEWRPIESAPKDGTRIIGARGLFCSILRWSERGSVFSPHPGWRNANGDLVSPTRFRPLPTPPSEKTS